MANIRTGRKSGFIVRDGRSVRETLWLGIARTSNTLAVSATALQINVMTALQVALAPYTIVRSRGTWLCFSDQQAASEEYVGSLGFSVVSSQASAIGVTALPTPATDQGSDAFFVYESWNGKRQFGDSTGFYELVPRSYDSRAMRKVEDGFEIAFTIESGLGGNGVAVDHVGRILLKLH